MKIKLPLIGLLTLLSVWSFAQSSSIEGLSNINKAAVQPISVNNVVEGYYAFYEVDKKDRKNRVYKLIIFDNNVSPTHNIDMVKSKNTVLAEGKFNGTHFCFLFVDPTQKENFQELVFYDKTGEKTGSFTYGTKKTSIVYNLSEDNVQAQSLTPLPGHGFVAVTNDMNNGSKSTLLAFDNTGKKIWETESMFGKEKSYESQSVMYAGETYIFASTTGRQKLMSAKDMKTEFRIYYSESGKSVGNFELNEGIHALNPYGCRYLEETGEILIYGEYYARNKQGQMDLDEKLGLFIRKHKPDGTLIKEQLTSWENDLKPIIPEDPEEKKSDKMSIYIHNIMRTSDGKYYAIGEQYRKVLSAGGIAANVASAALGGNASNSNMQVNLYDMMVFEFDENLEPIKIENVDKQKTRVYLPAGFGVIQKDKLAFLMAMFGWFDYYFTTMSSTGDNFNSVYLNYDKKGNKDSKNKYTIGNITLKDGSVETQRINLDTDPTFFLVFPAKPGYVAVFEYFKKEKTGWFRLEKLDI